MTTEHQEYTPKKIKKLIKKNNVKWIRVEFIDVIGKVMKVEIPAYRINNILQGKIMFDGSSITGYSAIQKSDLYLQPDLSTFLILPNPSLSDSKEPAHSTVARIICDVKKTDGTPFMHDPRTLLKQEIKKMQGMGFDTFNVGLEPEFFLIKKINSNPSNHKPAEKLPADKISYFEIQAGTKVAQCRREIGETLMDMGLPIEAAHHEVAPGQQEIDFRFSDAVNTADNIELFKYVAQSVASRYGYNAIFTPKPIKGENGSGMHINQSLMNDGENVFYDPNSKDKLSNYAHDYILGLLKHAKAFTALADATKDSYKRLIPGYEAPTYIAWGLHNRTALVRIPSDRGIATRCELRSADMTSNPYLIEVAVLASGLDGIKHHLSKTKFAKIHKPVEDNIFKMDKYKLVEKHIDHLPTSLAEAKQNLSKDKLLKKFYLK